MPEERRICIASKKKPAEQKLSGLENQSSRNLFALHEARLLRLQFY
jgi:hypothetical protein